MVLRTPASVLMAATLFGFDLAQWMVILTFALVTITGGYVVLTWWLARSASRSAKAAEKSADSAREAAEATARAAEVAEAALEVDFDVTYGQVVSEEAEQDWLSVTCKGAAVYLHGLQLAFGALTRRGGPLVFVGAHRELEPVEEELPRRISRGENMTFDWPLPMLDVAQAFVLPAIIEYSIRPDGPILSLTRLVRAEEY